MVFLHIHAQDHTKSEDKLQKQVDGSCEFQDSLSYREQKSYLKKLKNRQKGRREGKKEGVPEQDLLRVWAVELEIAELTASATN